MKIEIEKALTSLKAFLPEDQEVIDIIQTCQLYPTTSWRHWTDHLGHVLSILENKKVIIIKEHPLSPSEKIIADLYHKSLPDKILTNSSNVVIAFGEGDKQSYHVCFIWLLGKDGRLRLSTFVKNEWIENNSPLICGMKTLRVISKYIRSNSEITYCNKEIKGPVPANIIKIWATSIPLDNKIKLDMLLTNNTLGLRLLKDLGLQ